MASSSSAFTKLCFHCKAPSVNFFIGWQLRNGGFAMLCYSCGSAYSKGTFCDTFHPEATGWRDCASCRKRIHCGCIMASSTYTILDFGGVKCTECAVNEALAPHRCSPSFWSPQAIQHAMDSAKRLYIDHEKAITGIKSGIDPIASPNSVVCNVLPKKIATPTIPGAAFQAQFPLSETGEESSVNSPDGTNNSCQKKGGKHRKDVYRKTRVQSRYSPQTSLEELKEICRVDAEARNGRLVLPKRCAEAYFPDISAQQGIFVVVQDIKGDDWEFYYRYWSNTNGKMYVLEGLKDYIISEQWQPGDTVTFYKREEDGKLFMGLKKVQAGKSD
ncbi:B3 domain-containing protein Os07g0563300-like isoform X2 [Herrania umbratica]|uniref:B3 domain-containing protein Os07g0563300-like isoform X2 n=1 Tax=Herrania umbratica TaxID=108875 RepID=A0A6J1AMK9_9ROSI|nr:B3 domain-containing protein Os07g0563300-like isoform X2 [Herrania umbratica]